MKYFLRVVVHEPSWERQLEDIVSLCHRAGIEEVLLKEQCHQILMSPFPLEKQARMAAIYKRMGARLRAEGIGFSISLPSPGAQGGEDARYLLVLGEDIQDLTLQGYANGSLEADAVPLEGCGATLERYETDLDAVLREILPLLLADRLEGEGETADTDLLYRAFLEQLLAHGALSPDPAARYAHGWLEDIAADVWTLGRVCWLEAEATVPAGGSVELAASFSKEASYDYSCADRANRGLYGYDLVTTLGSSLLCRSQTAVLEDRGQIEIVRQNFGFDLAAGVKAVPLDSAREHYCLEVRRRAGAIPDGAPAAGS